MWPPSRSFLFALSYQTDKIVPNSRNIFSFSSFFFYEKFIYFLFRVFIKEKNISQPTDPTLIQEKANKEFKGGQRCSLQLK